MNGGLTLRVAAWPATPAGAANPYACLLTESLRRLGVEVEELQWKRLRTERYDVVHVHWPEWVFDAAPVHRRVHVLTSLALARLRGARVVWTVHNIGGHDRDRAAGRGFLWHAFARMVDGWVSLTEIGIEPALVAFPALRRARAFVIPHGHYRDVYTRYDGARARRELGIANDVQVMLCFGHVRRYKGIPALLDAFRSVPGSEVRLLIVGEPVDDDLRREIDALAARDPRVRAHLQRVPHDDVARYFAAADLVVLPYTETLNSGAALLALSLDRPVLASALGAFPELQSRVGERWLRTFEGPIRAADLVESFGSLDRALPPPDLAPFDWSAVGIATLAAYRELRTESASTPRRRVTDRERRRRGVDHRASPQQSKSGPR